MHVQVGHLSQVPSFDLIEFLSEIFFPKFKFPKLGVYAGVYGTLLTRSQLV